MVRRTIIEQQLKHVGSDTTRDVDVHAASTDVFMMLKRLDSGIPTHAIRLSLNEDGTATLAVDSMKYGTTRTYTLGTE